MNLSPICLFTYNRFEETKRTIEALQNNYLAKESELYIFSDGPKNSTDEAKVANVRSYLKTISVFKKITVIESEKNKGLANSIIQGVTQIINEFGRVVVMEDDLLTSPNFLNFMNESLEFYSNKKQIFSVSGYTMDLPSLKKYNKDYYIGYRSSSWGWGTWKEQWEKVDWDMLDYSLFRYDFLGQIKFNKGGSDMSAMLKKQMKGEIDSWAIRWCYTQYKYNMLTVFASSSKVESIGFGELATHTKNTKRFDTFIDTSNNINFLFDQEIRIDRKIAAEFKNKFSILNRLKDKFL